MTEFAMGLSTSMPSTSERVLLVFAILGWALFFACPVFAQDGASLAHTAHPANKVVEREIRLEVEGNTIVGTLALPIEVKSAPVILVLGGFDPTRDGLPVRGTTESVYSRAARLWAERGYGSLRISMRGTGGSGGNSQDMTLETRIAEATACIKWLAQRPEVDGKKIAVVGYNQGAVIGIAAAGRLGQSQIVKSIALWTPITNPLFYYADRVGIEKLEQGLAAKPGEVVGLASKSGTVRPLTHAFYKDVWTISPAAELVPYKGAMLIVMGSRDKHIPAEIGEGLLRYHTGPHQLTTIDADQGLGSFEGAGVVDLVALRTLEWFEHTLN